MGKKMTKAEKIATTPVEIIAQLKGEEGRKKLIKDIKSMRFSYKRRVQSFMKHKVISYAQISFELQSTELDKKNLEDLTRNQLIYLFFRYADFFNSKTSTIIGAEQVNREQDVRIFGVDSKGRPKRRMTESERNLFWTTYDEYKNQYPADINQAFSSESIQQTIADALFSNEDIQSRGLLSVLWKVREDLQKRKNEEDIENVPNIFSGRRSSFDW